MGGVELGFAETLDEEPPHRRHLRGAARREDRVDVAVAEARPRQRVVGRSRDPGEVGSDQPFELAPGDVGVEPDAGAVETSVVASASDSRIFTPLIAW